MLSGNNLKILEFLLRNIDEYNINQMAKELKISVGGAHKILKGFERSRFVKGKRLGNAIYYGLNLQNREVRKLCELVLMESKRRALDSNPQASVYSKDLEEAASFSKAAALFGSVVNQEEVRDIDVLFITTKKGVKRVEDFCLKLSSVRMKSISPLIMTSGDLKNNVRRRDEVVLEILKKSIVIYGEGEIVEILRSI